MSRACMPLDVPDYRADTGHLSTIEHGAYLLLIMHYWMTGGLPDDDTKLARITGMTQDEWTQAKPTLGALFTAGWRHKRIERELGEVALSEKRAEAGRRGAEARWFANGKTNDASLSIEKKEVIKKGRERGTRLPSDWQPTAQGIETAKAEGLTEADIAREAAKFRDYWIAKPGAAGVKLDWQATWRNWCRRAAEYLGRSPQVAIGKPKTLFVPVDSPKWGQLSGRWREANKQTTGPLPRDYPVGTGWYFPSEWLNDGYDAQDDFNKSLDEGYQTIRERVAAGGKPWTN